jgi:hypothetical protein
MFEDIKNKDTQGLPHSTEDMFDAVDPQADAQPAVSRPPQPVMGNPIPGPVMPPVGPAQPLQNLAELGPHYQPASSAGWMKKLGIWLLSVGLLAVLGYGGWYAYTTYLAPAFQAQNTPNPATGNNNVNQQTNTNQPAATNEPTTSQPVTATPVIDQDQDGLPDVEESFLATSPTDPDTDKDGLTDYEEVKIYNSDPLLPDTDNDGLNDREEVMTWKTNPRLPDTDSDGYQDGEEIRNGYNPLGPGKLAPADALPAPSNTPN